MLELQFPPLLVSICLNTDYQEAPIKIDQESHLLFGKFRIFCVIYNHPKAEFEIKLFIKYKCSLFSSSAIIALDFLADLK